MQRELRQRVSRSLPRSATRCKGSPVRNKGPPDQLLIARDSRNDNIGILVFLFNFCGNVHEVKRISVTRNDEAVDCYLLISFVCKTASFCTHLTLVTSFVCKMASLCTQQLSVTSFVCTRGCFCTRKLTLSRSWRSEGLHSWQIRQPALSSKLRELRQRAHAACCSKLAGVFARCGALHYA